MKRNLYNRMTVFAPILLTLVMVQFAITGCNEEDIPFIQVSQEHIDMAADGLKHRVEVQSNVQWTAVSDSDWCKVVGGKGNLKGAFDIVLDSNDKYGKRTATVTVSQVGGMSIAVIVRQMSADLKLDISHSSLEFNKEQDSYQVKVLSNNTWEAISSHSSWCEVSVPTGENPGYVNITVKDNTTSKDRTAKVTISTEGDGKNIMKTIDITQTSLASQLIVSPNQKEVSSKGEVFSVSITATAAWKATSDSDWLTIDKSEGSADDNIQTTVTTNTTSKSRTATLTISTTSTDVAREVRTVTVTQEAEGLEVLAEEVNLNSFGDSIYISVVSSSDFAVRSSSPWCDATVENKEVKVKAGINNTGGDREAIVTVISSLDERLTRTFKVKQPEAKVEFSITPATCTLVYEGETKQLTVNTIGEWELATNELPLWLVVTPTSGTGNATISVTAEKNQFIKERSIDLSFENKLISKSVVVTVQQSKNPSSAIDDYKYLGKGYDAGGEFAVDTYVKAQVLDWNKLDDKGYIADIITASQTDEHRIHEKTLSEYQKSLSHKAGISGNYAGFSASVQGSYSSKTLMSEENEFASFRHITQKQIVKLGEHLSATELKSCMNETASSEINSALTADQVIQKYGTHIIAGFVLGGSLDYTMTADASSMSKQVDWSISVEAGYQSLSGGVKGNYSYEQYESMKTESTNFEEKLVARGGDSQMASLLGTEASRASWLASLSNPSKWVMVDYAGKMLIPIWEFADNATRKTDLEASARKHMQKSLITQVSTHKTLKLKAFEIKYMDTDPGDNTAQVAYRLHATVDRYTQERFGTTYEDEGGSGDVFPKPSGADVVKINHSTKEYKFSIYKPHVLVIDITGKEKDFKGDSDDPFKMSVTFNYDSMKGKWIKEGTTEEYGRGDTFWIDTTSDGVVGKQTLATFHFELSWQ